MSPYQWPTTAPEVQGVDSGALSRLLEDVHARNVNLHTLHLIRHGHLILDAYRYPYHAESRLDVRSIAKSITALVVGIALDEGAISDLDRPVLSFFPDRTLAEPDVRKTAITLRHLLTMTSGLALNDADAWHCFTEPDAVQWALESPMGANPGESFVYSSTNYYLLSAVMQAQTGRTLAEYAQANFFDPLGIEHVRWMPSPQGITLGCAGLWLTGRDLAAVGQMVLNRGGWRGRQVVPDTWIAASMQIHAGENYGLGWWIERDTAVMSGYGGQLVVVDAARDLVIVITSGLRDANPVLYGLIDTFVLPALHGDPLPANPVAAADLARRVVDWGDPHPVRIPALPESARQIDGQRWVWDENGLGLTALTVILGESGEPSGPDPALILESGDDRASLPLGLDGVLRDVLVPRLGPLADQDHMAATGAWRDDHTLVIVVYSVNNPEHWTITITVEGDGIALHWEDMLTGYGEAVRVTG